MVAKCLILIANDLNSHELGNRNIDRIMDKVRNSNETFNNEGKLDLFFLYYVALIINS